MFDQTPPHTLDKIMAKLVPMKTISKLDLQPKGQGHSNPHPMGGGGRHNKNS